MKTLTFVLDFTAKNLDKTVVFENYREIPAKMKPTTRPTIGLLTSLVWKDIFQELWWGVMDASQANGVNVVCFPGDELPDSKNPILDSQANIVYNLANAELLDGLIIWSRILSWHSGDQVMQSFINAYSHLPLVTIETGFEGIPAVMLTEYDGIQELLEHLFSNHNYQRIAHIRGPWDDSTDVIFKAYSETLTARGVFDPKLVTPPVDWNQENGAAMVALLMDERGLVPGVDFDVILAADDALALGAINALHSRGLHVPRDIAVVGFDDTPNARSITPALTTVRHSYYDVGRQAVEILLQKMDGQFVPDEKYLPAELVIRQSCGCLEPSVVEATVTNDAIGLPSENFIQYIDENLDELTTRLMEIVGASENDQLQPEFEKLLAPLINDPLGILPEEFLLALEEMLKLIAAVGLKLSAGQDVISYLHQQFSQLAQEDGVRQKIENLWHQARVLVSKTAEREQRNRILQAERRAQILREVGQRLIRTFDVEGITTILEQGLQDLNIPGCCLALYESPQPYQFPQSAPEWSNLIFIQDGSIHLAAGDSTLQNPKSLKFLTRQLIPGDLLSSDRPVNLIVEPLYFGQQQLGFGVFEIGPREGLIYDTLRGHLSTALQGANLLTEALTAKNRAEKADQLKTRLLANVSHELRAPLNIILGYTWAALNTPDRYDLTLTDLLLHDFQQIHDNADHQIRVINDLLDLSRAEIDELDHYPELIDPVDFLRDIFNSVAAAEPKNSVIDWQLKIPNQLPVIQADPVRLRQILLNLLSNAGKFTTEGAIVLGAEVAPPDLHNLGSRYGDRHSL